MPKTKTQIRALLDEILRKMDDAANYLENRGKDDDALVVDEAAQLVEDLRKGRYASAREKREEAQFLRDIESGKIQCIRIGEPDDSTEFLDRIWALEDPRLDQPSQQRLD